MNQQGKISFQLILLAFTLTIGYVMAQTVTTLGPYGTDETNIQCQTGQVTALPTGAYVWSNSVVYPTPTFDPQREQVNITGKDNTNNFVTVQRSSSAAYAHPRGSKMFFNSTATVTNTFTFTPTFTNTKTNTPSFTQTFTTTDTPSFTPTFTMTSTPSFTPTFTPTFTHTGSPTPIPHATVAPAFTSTPVAVYIENPGTKTTTHWDFQLQGVNPWITTGIVVYTPLSGGVTVWFPYPTIWSWSTDDRP